MTEIDRNNYDCFNEIKKYFRDNFQDFNNVILKSIRIKLKDFYHIESIQDNDFRTKSHIEVCTDWKIRVDYMSFKLINYKYEEIEFLGIIIVMYKRNDSETGFTIYTTKTGNFLLDCIFFDLSIDSQLLNECLNNGREFNFQLKDTYSD